MGSQKLHVNFWQCRASRLLNPALFKGQLYLILGIKIYTFKMYQHLARQIRACSSQWQQHSNIVIKHDLVLLHRKPALGIQLYGPGNSYKLFLISCSLAIPTLCCIVTKTCSGMCLHLITSLPICIWKLWHQKTSCWGTTNGNHWKPCAHPNTTTQ